MRLSLRGGAGPAPSAPARGGQDARSALGSRVPLGKITPASSDAEHSGNQSVNQSGKLIFARINLASRKRGAEQGCWSGSGSGSGFGSGSALPGPALLFRPGALTRAPRVSSGSPGATSDRLPGGPGREAPDQA